MELDLDVADAQPEATGGQDAPEVSDGRFQIVVDGFEGPLDLLLSLIAKHKLDVTELALHQVTDEFIAHIRAQGAEWDLDEASEFLLIAATLLDLKAARLLPIGEVEDEEDLAILEARDILFARLLQYRAFKEVSALLASRIAEASKRRPRTVGLDPALAALLPEVLINIGLDQFASIAAAAMAPKPPPPSVSVAHVHAPKVSVREQAGIIADRVKSAGPLTFRELIADAENRLVVVGRFLALLELYREGLVLFEQPAALGDLTVTWSGDQDATVSEDFDEFDDDIDDDIDDETASDAPQEETHG